MSSRGSSWFRPAGIAAGVLLIFSALAVLFSANYPRAKARRASATPPLLVRGVTISLEPLTAQARATGLIEPIKDITIYAETHGRVSARPLEEDSHVKRGELLLRLDDTYKKTALAKAEAALEEARSVASLQESESRRARKLHQAKVISSHELDRQLNRETVARASLRVAEQKLREAREDLAKTLIQSPIDGIVVDFFFEPFEFVSEGQPVARVIDNRRLKLVVEVSDRERVGIHPGVEATILLDTFPGEPFHGLVVRLGQAASTESNKFPVEIQFDNPGQRLLPGMVAEASIPLSASRKAMLVPKESVLESFGQHFLFVAAASPNGLRAQRRPVKIKRVPFLPTQLEVTEGLRDGDIVITNMLRRLKSGTAVRIIR